MTILESIMAAPTWFWLISLAVAIGGGLCLFGFLLFVKVEREVKRNLDWDDSEW